MNYKFTAIFAAAVLSASAVFSQASEKPLITSSSKVDWTTQEFSSQVLFNVEKANIPMPSGKNSALDRISLEMPKLIKDQLLSLAVDSSTNLGDLALNHNITLEEIASLIEDGKRTPGFFTESSSIMKTNHTMNLRNLSSLMIKHHVPYSAKTPIEIVPSRAYSGIIIDARGKLPVQGEFLSDEAVPCFFPKIWDEQMNLVYERNMMNPDKAKSDSIIAYAFSEDEQNCIERAGKDPLRILARKVYGQTRTDPVISAKDALKILTIPENIKLLEQGKIVILLDKKNLVYDVSVPVKDDLYYTAWNAVQKLLYKDKVKDLTIQDTYKGILFQVDLKFYADSSILLPEESTRIAKIAAMLNEITQANEFTILVEGHAASVGRPQGELTLSIERARSVIQALENFGVKHELFSFQGYGSSQPIADNNTPEGRAQNRRVDITARPKATYIQRDWN
ncbi:MAG: OmpA family protein [Treponema sp.]|nr:OmpA family protein [Treponema sp.]